MRYTKRDESFCFGGSGCNLHYVGIQPLNINIDEENIDYVEGLFNKVGQLEDIEDELGIDLITLFKALKNGIYAIYYKGQEPHEYGGLEYNLKRKALTYHWCSLEMSGYDSGTEYFPFEDYGKTWALTKEELL